jgi:DNA replication protein DnaC
MNNVKPLKSALEGLSRNKKTTNARENAPGADYASRSDPDAGVDAREGTAPCKTCGNKRYVINPLGELKPCPDCDVAQKWKVRAISAYSSSSESTRKQTFLNFKMAFEGEESPILKRCLQRAEKFADAPQGKWLVIWGERGAGKSHLCAAVDNHLYQTRTPSLFITMPDLLASLRQAMEFEKNTEQESYSGRMRLFKTAPVLILDDLGADTGSPWADGVLFEIVDYRYRNRLATMIATNVNPDDFDPRIASRMQDREFSTVIENAAPDFRRRPKKDR